MIGESELRLQTGTAARPGIGGQGMPAVARPAVEPTAGARPDARLQATFDICLLDHRLSVGG